MTTSTHTHSLDAAERTVAIQAGGVELDGDLAIPEGARGIVLFAHGSGSSRHSFRNRFVAEELRSGGLGTLLFDLLTVHEEQVDLHTRQIRFDIGLLADRLIGAMAWLDTQDDTRGLPVGLFGASTCNQTVHKNGASNESKRHNDQRPRLLQSRRFGAGRRSAHARPRLRLRADRG